MPSSGVQTCALDRKSTRLNSSHTIISYAVFCLKKNNCPTNAQSCSATCWRPRPASPRTGVRGSGLEPEAVRPGRAGAEVVHYLVFFFFNDTATTEIYALSLHVAFPI